MSVEQLRLRIVAVSGLFAASLLALIWELDPKLSFFFVAWGTGLALLTAIRLFRENGYKKEQR